jgi:phenylalanine-4-hydroxylase
MALVPHAAPGTAQRLPRSIEHYALWTSLYERQVKALEHAACSDFMKGLWVLDIRSDPFPDIRELNRRLRAATAWQVEPVDAPTAPSAFFEYLSHRVFPISDWMRHRSELNGVVDADLFHDLFGHVPMLAQPVFAEYLQQLGKAARAQGTPAAGVFMRHFEHTVEHGVVRTARGLRLYGATLLSESTGPLHTTGASVEPGTPMQLGFWSAARQPMELGSTCIVDRFDHLLYTLPTVTPRHVASGMGRRSAHGRETRGARLTRV